MPFNKTCVSTYLEYQSKLGKSYAAFRLYQTAESIAVGAHLSWLRSPTTHWARSQGLSESESESAWVSVGVGAAATNPWPTRNATLPPASRRTDHAWLKGACPSLPGTSPADQSTLPWARSPEVSGHCVSVQSLYSVHTVGLKSIVTWTRSSIKVKRQLPAPRREDRQFDNADLSKATLFTGF